MSVVESIKKAAEENKERIELARHGSVAFRIVEGKVRGVNFNDGVLVDQGESQG